MIIILSYSIQTFAAVAKTAGAAKQSLAVNIFSKQSLEAFNEYDQDYDAVNPSI